MSHRRPSFAITSKASIDHFPTEILNEIFEWSSTARGRGSYKFTTFDTTALTLCSVSRTWQSIAVSSLKIWATIVVYEPGLFATELVKLYLAQAGPKVLLTLSLSIPELDCTRHTRLDQQDKLWFIYRKHTNDILNLWFEHSSRWQSIDFDFTTLCGITFPSVLLTETRNFPCLQDVVVRFSIETNSEEPELAYKKFWENMLTLPTLRTTWWGNLTHYWYSQAPFEQLTSIYMPYIPLYEGYLILRQCGRLENLTIGGFGSLSNKERKSISKMSFPIVLPRLRSFAFKPKSKFSPAGPDLDELLNHLSLPQLEDLSLHSLYHSFPERILADKGEVPITFPYAPTNRNPSSNPPSTLDSKQRRRT